MNGSTSMNISMASCAAPSSLLFREWTMVSIMGPVVDWNLSRSAGASRSCRHHDRHSQSASVNG